MTKQAQAQVTRAQSMKRIHGREAIAQALGEHYTRKMNGKVWSRWDEAKRAYSIEGSNLPSHPDLRETYPNGWSMLDYVPPSKARAILKADGFEIAGEPKLESKRIHKVVVKRMYDDSPDTSWLGEYSDRPTSEYSIDRAHDLDCLCQPYNRVSGEGERILDSAQEYLCARMDESFADEDLRVWYDDGDSFISAILAGDAEEFCLGSCVSHWSNREYRYFNPSFNYVDKNGKPTEGLTAVDVRTYTRQDYERMESLHAGNWGFIGIRAEAQYSMGNGGRAGTCVLQELSSGGLWGIESDSNKEYFAEVEAEELAELRKHLVAIGFSQRAISAAFRQVEREGE